MLAFRHVTGRHIEIRGWGRYSISCLQSLIPAKTTTTTPPDSFLHIFSRPTCWQESLPFLTGAARVTAVSLQASGSLSNPLSLRVMVLNAPWVPLLSDPKLLRLRQSLDDRPGVGEVGGESQLIRRSGAVTDEVNGSWACFLGWEIIPAKATAFCTALSWALALGGGGLGGAIFFLPGSELGRGGALLLIKMKQFIRKIKSWGKHQRWTRNS